ncbi:hypothetical protein BEP19_12885 [Ammoniphilus oxalaticus]|uniref:GNAT family N-acetyltransferase n=1 Tax=Ammoniphilus oxalaticus TaxID=66863 RepID=A0A419SH44_9BACL|nr:GNAT family N-acetyltransferase [Ammoniphilus oxalaticus]RKD23112.1 hypothetical protein BEP19_12885 [Ammoniphilus oxalaticus]
MNILLTSVGRRSYLVKYFKDALGNSGEVHVSNSSAITPAFTFADKCIVTPLIYDENYIPFLLDYCEQNNIKAVISLFDIDLPVLSANKHAFLEIGTQVIVSNKSVINICNDKFETYKFLINNGFNAPKTLISLYSALDAIQSKSLEYPLIIKPRWGMGSIGVFEAHNEDELGVFYNKVISEIKGSYLKYEIQGKLEESVLIQEKLPGQEYGLDIINNLDGEYQNTVVKRKYAMRSGETDSAETVDNSLLKDIGENISKSLQHIANLDVDVFLKDNIPYILEMNARFGGGYPFSHMAGVNLPLAIVKWLDGQQIDSTLLTERIGVLAHKDIEIVHIQNEVDDYKIIRLETSEEICNVLTSFDYVFQPSISQRIENLNQYAQKLKDNALVYAAKDTNNQIIGFVVFYVNDMETKTGYVTFLAVQPYARRRKLGEKLLDFCINESRENEMSSLKLEVRKHNEKAIRLYEKNGFEYCDEASGDSVYMIKKL